MTHPVTSLTLDSARFCVMQSVFLTQGTVSSIPISFNWGGSIGPEGFRPSILLLMVILVMVSIVVAVVLVVVDTIIRIVIVVVGFPSIIKLAFVITENNVGESLVKTLLNVLGKTKDGMNARLDLAKLGIKPKLFGWQEEDKTTLPPACYTLTNDEKTSFVTKDGMNARLDLAKLGIKPKLFGWQEEDKTTLPPAGYTLTNDENTSFVKRYATSFVKRMMKRHILFSCLVSLKGRKLIGLKSPDYHMLIQEF
uniref:Uncharacterized protein n=1 Tax=Tanacetum cinerariifolium TaxID=118510 RepID=A0A699L5G2_TANCI|nr:hypothetical protein [Tanacetum cinerariifolium]